MSNGGEKNVFLFSWKRFSSAWTQQRPKVFSSNMPDHVKVAEEMYILNIPTNLEMEGNIEIFFAG